VEGGFIQCGHSADKGGSSGADVRIFWCKKHRIFEIYGVSARTGGVKPVWTKGEGAIIRNFVRVTFIVGHLLVKVHCYFWRKNLWNLLMKTLPSAFQTLRTRTCTNFFKQTAMDKFEFCTYCVEYEYFVHALTESVTVE